MSKNSFFDVAGVAMDFLTGFSQASLNLAINDAQKVIDDSNTYSANLINNTNADAANKMRVANNGLAAAQAAFSNLQRSIGNKSKLEAAGDRLDANGQNLIRLQDATVRGSLEQSLRASEQLGAMHAQAAAAGIGGATAAMLHNTMALAAARQKTTTETNAGYQTYDMLQQRMGLMSNMATSVDAGQTFAPIDYSVTVAPLVQSPLRAGDFAPSPMSQALLSTLSKSGNLQTLSDVGSMLGNSDKAATPLPKPTSLDMGDGWNNFSTRSFGEPKIEGLGSGFYGVGGESNGFFATGSSAESAFSFRLK